MVLFVHHKVMTCDMLQEKVDKINQRILPIRDEDLEKYLTEKDLDLKAATCAKEAYKDADFVIISVPTNYDSTTNKFDTQ